MPLKLSSAVTELPRVGPAKAKYLTKLGITHARDFLYTFPRRYNDFSKITPVNELKVGEQMTVQGVVKSAKSNQGWRGRRRLLRVYVEIEDDTGVLNVTWFNLRFLMQQLGTGRNIAVAGTVEQDTRSKQLRMRSPVIEFLDGTGEQTHTGRITPVYPETYGVTSRFLRYQVKQALPLLQRLPEYIPADIRERHELVGIHEAITTMHFPDDTDALEVARRRVRFDELFFLQLAALVRRAQREQRSARPLPVLNLTQFKKQLDFTLTAAQLEVIDEIATDIGKPVPMNRLLQGDVGSGKSVVALFAARTAMADGHKVLYLAPTEILARQQAKLFAKTLGEDSVALLIGALPSGKKRALKERLRTSDPLCVVGTHAVLQEDVQVANLALAIVDEQHRFGVEQRQALQEASDDDMVPHLLSMTATPIPRTLNLTVYGDLDVSVLDELPPGRMPVTTSVVPPGERDDAVVHILEELHAGRQGFVIAPLVEESERLEAKSATEAYGEMRKLFPDIAIGLLHGRMSSEEKAGVINNFSAGALQLLVSTSVVEVGVNVPNATVMIIEGAERFGLAQLHQFRGRIGRGEHQSYCYLFPTSDEAVTAKRLQVLATTTDGFVIAEEDLKLRGPGEVYGAAQSGFGDLQVASLLDYPTIKIARQEAVKILKNDPQLDEYPILKAKVEQKNLLTHFE
ncbi:ATP-dependent DNA helicase RecG [bacterium]|nr:ATP-dependent DNA helicase RecG [bacterium]